MQSPTETKAAPHDALPDEPDVAEVSGRLKDGIASCRSVISNYRSLLTDEQPPTETPDPGPKVRR
jgi:hypothetical protein